MNKTKDLALDQIKNAWCQFEARFANEQDCFKELYGHAAKEGWLACSKCSDPRLQLIDGTRFLLCSACSNRQSLTAGTILHRGKVIRTWCAALWFIERQIVISSNELASRTGVAQSTAWVILKKLAIHLSDAVMSVEDDRVESAWFYSLFQKRSRLTPANGHPLEEQTKFDRPAPICETQPLQSVEVTSENPVQPMKNKIVQLLTKGNSDYDQLMQECTASHGELAEALFDLETQRIIVSLPGNIFTLNKSVRKPATHSQTEKPLRINLVKKIEQLMDTIKLRCRGISRRYLQLYVILAAVAHRERTSGKRYDLELFSIINRANVIKHSRLLEYTTDKFVCIPFTAC